jgi:hypothetical protein
VVHDESAAMVTRVPPTTQLRAFAWLMPKLWPTSWLITWTLSVPLRYE